MSGIGVYPGSFDPPTVAHLAIAEAARDQAGLDRVVLAVSRQALGKGEGAGPRLADRLAVLTAIADRLGWLGVVLTDQQLIADVSAGYDAVIVGADKWAQILDPVWYDSLDARDAAVATAAAGAGRPETALFPCRDRAAGGGARASRDQLECGPGRTAGVDGTGGRRLR